jgi:hypothetical protein
VVPAALRTFYIDAASGNDAANGLTPGTAWKTLDKANNTAQAGDLFLLSGTFVNELIHPTTSGTAVAKIVYRTKPGSTAVVDGGQFESIIWLEDVSHVVVDGLELRNEIEVALIRNASNIWLRNLYIHDADGGVHIESGSDNRLEDSNIQRIGNEAANTGEAVFLNDGSHRNAIVRNTIAYAGHGLIWVSFLSETEPTSDDNVIERNDLSNPWASGLGLNGKTNRTVVQCNRIHDAADGTGANYARAGIEVEGTANVIRFNEVYHNGRQGITIQGRDDFGGVLQNAVGNHVHNNTFWQNGVDGFESVELIQIGAGNVLNNIIENNIFWGDAGLLYDGSRYSVTANLYNANSVWATGNANGNIVRNNIFPTGQSVFLIIRNPNNSEYTLAQAEATFNGWQQGKQVDPMFVNMAAGDVRLQTGSPAIDAGRIITGIPYLGAGPDIGAHELR